MDVGDVYVYPTCEGLCVNPYFASKEQLVFLKYAEGFLPQDKWAAVPQSRRSWEQDGWSAFIVIDRGRAFDFLSWYRPLTLAFALQQEPTLPVLHGDLLWKLEDPGTCPPVHFRRMELRKTARLTVDAGKLRRVFPNMRPGTIEAINDISLANHLSVDPAFPVRRLSPQSTMLGINQIASE